MKTKILIVDDQSDIRVLLSEFLEDEGYEVFVASDGQDALKLIEFNKPDIVLLDIWLNDKRFDGIGILDIIREKFPNILTIMMSGHGNIETAVSTLKKGAFDFIEKPFQSERLSSMLSKAQQVIALKRELNSLRENIHLKSHFVGSSKSIDVLTKKLKKIAQTETRVMFIGEAGVGKSQAARYVHFQSDRAKNPFIEVNCASLDKASFLETFFGSETQSPEGYPVIKVGLLEQANLGTLVLENIQDLPEKMHSQLAHVLHSKKFQRIGGSISYDINIRFLSTLLLEEGARPPYGIREDLYHRLAVTTIEIPTLVQHREDIEELFHYFYSQITAVQEPIKLSQEVKFILSNYPWPGNIRQLRNVVEWMAMQRKENEGELNLQHLPNDLLNSEKNRALISNDELFIGPLKEAREKFEKSYLEFHLGCTHGNIKKTAEEIGMDRTALHRKIKALGIEISDDIS
jgi:two-component system nitrogen regulation response regulator NtrX